MSESKRIRYEAETGETLFVEVPWGNGSGMIPPPEIAFYVSETGRYRTFVYRG